MSKQKLLDQKLWNVKCKLCTLEVQNTSEWIKDAQGASYHRICYEGAIIQMTKFIMKNVQPRKP